MPRHFHIFHLYFLFLLSPLIALPVRGFAEEQQGRPVHGFSEVSSPGIVVEGTSLESTLSSLPASATVVSGEEVAEADPSSLQEQIIRLPNLNFAGGSSRPRFFQIRGIGELEQYEGAPNSSVAVIVDDVDLTGIGAALTLFDIDQLEVHRGPQPTRFGSSALAGALHIKTSDPTQSTNGQTLLTVGNDELISGGAAFSTPLSDQIALRLSAFGHAQNGFRDNDFLGVDDTNERKEFTGRAKLLFEPSDRSRFLLSFTDVDLNNGYDAFTIFNGFHTQSDRPGYDEERLRLGSLHTEIDVSPSDTLLTTTSFYKSEVDYAFDGDWGNNPFWEPNAPYDYFSDQDRAREVFAQQVRLRGTLFGSEVRYLIGSYFQSFQEDTQTNEFSDNIVYDSLDSDYEADTYAGFGSLEVPLAEKLRLLLGARLEQRDARYVDSRESYFTPDDFLWGGSATLQYDLTDSLMTYLLVSRGFRGGGFNSSPSTPADRMTYSPESLINLEAGTRFSAFGGDASGSLAAFVNWREDQQIKLSLQVDPDDPLSFLYLTDNAARGKSYGLEAEVRYAPTENVEFRTSGSLLDTEIVSVQESLAALEGRDQSHAPEWQYFAETEYFFSEEISGLIGVSGRDAFYFDDSHDQRSEPYHLLHAGLFYRADNWELQLWGRNLTDKEYAIRGFYFGNEPPDFPEKEYVQLADRRSFGVTWRYFF